MDLLLAKIFSTALAFSQLTSGPDNIRTHFDPQADTQRVVELLQAGCSHLRKTFDIEDINLDDLIATAMDDVDSITAGHVVFRGIDVKALYVGYRQFCKNETVEDSPVDIAAVISFYNATVADLPDHTRLKGLKLPGSTAVFDLKGQPYSEVFQQHHRRVWLPLADIPQHVQRTFVAAEDRRFYEHNGVDERALVRAFIGNLAGSSRPQGGSTITQQLVKNLLVGEEVSYDRKIREMILAARVEQTLTKAEILELYVNTVYLGRASWGIEMAARSYFGKSAGALTPVEGAMLAALLKGPNYYNPDRNAERFRTRMQYVLGRMAEEGIIAEEERREIAAGEFPVITYAGAPQGSYFADHIAREARSIAKVDAFSAGSFSIRATLHPDIQRATEAALQEGLARYEIAAGRVRFDGPEMNLGEAIATIERGRAKPLQEQPEHPGAEKEPWQQALIEARLPLYDVHWPAGVVLEIASGRGGVAKVGLKDGRVIPLAGARPAILRSLKRHDVVLVRLTEGKGKSARAELRVRPVVQGAAVVLENKTGRILGMAGGFSYPLSPFNRVTQSRRQPGSAIKPLAYLAALEKGLQPNTLVRDDSITFLPIGGTRNARREDYWTPKNYDGRDGGIITLRQALETSRNIATARLLQGIDEKPATSLDRICELAIDLKLHSECLRYYPFVLGAQPVRPIDLATFYATIANEGLRPAPHAIEAIERKGQALYQNSRSPTETVLADRASFYQLKSMLQGVLQRGTAQRIAHLAPYVAGKTGTTDDEGDAWFVGFTNDVTVAVWVGYDNAEGRRTLGSGRSGGNVAIPIFEPIMQAVWEHHAPKVTLSPPSLEAQRLLVSARGDAGERKGKRSVEYLRRDSKGRAVDARFQLVSRKDRDTVLAAQTARKAPAEPGAASSWGWDRNEQSWPQERGWFGWGGEPRQQPRPSGGARPGRGEQATGAWSDNWRAW
jgi:membrane carboxypeptidase/penicillin-binding protein